MISKIKNYIREVIRNRNLLIRQQELLIKETKEILWAQVFHDSIKGNDFIEKLPLNIGRWAGDYSFFYVLNRILNEIKPKRILELGLGESTKMISTYLDNKLKGSTHIIVEQNAEWSRIFNQNFTLSERSEIIILPLIKKQFEGYETNCYESIETKITGDFDLYVIDGPFGSPRYSRSDIISFVQKFSPSQDFIILFDDTNRKGEMDTRSLIYNILTENNIKFAKGEYRGSKEVTVICSEKYQYLTTM